MCLRVDAMAASNPLDEWRKRSKFDTGALRELLFGKEIVDYKTRIWDTLSADPLFGDHGNDLTLHKKRELTFQRLQTLSGHAFLPDEAILEHPRMLLAFNEAIQVMDGSLLPVYMLNVEVCGVGVGVSGVLWVWVQ